MKKINILIMALVIFASSHFALAAEHDYGPYNNVVNYGGIWSSGSNWGALISKGSKWDSYLVNGKEYGPFDKVYRLDISASGWQMAYQKDNQVFLESKVGKKSVLDLKEIEEIRFFDGVNFSYKLKSDKYDTYYFVIDGKKYGPCANDHDVFYASKNNWLFTCVNNPDYSDRKITIYYNGKVFYSGGGDVDYAFVDKVNDKIGFVYRKANKLYSNEKVLVINGVDIPNKDKDFSSYGGTIMSTSKSDYAVYISDTYTFQKIITKNKTYNLPFKKDSYNNIIISVKLGKDDMAYTYQKYEGMGTVGNYYILINNKEFGPFYEILSFDYVAKNNWFFTYREKAPQPSKACPDIMDKMYCEYNSEIKININGKISAIKNSNDIFIEKGKVIAYAYHEGSELYYKINNKKYGPYETLSWLTYWASFSGKGDGKILMNYWKANDYKNLFENYYPFRLYKFENDWFFVYPVGSKLMIKHIDNK